MVSATLKKKPKGVLTPYEEEVVVKTKLTKSTILLTVSKDLNLTQGRHPLFLQTHIHVSAEYGLRAIWAMPV